MMLAPALQASDWAEEPDTGASTLDWNIHGARQDWQTAGRRRRGTGFGNLFDDYAVSRLPCS